jgi:hypothetical protein
MNAEDVRSMPCSALFDGYEGTFDASDKAAFSRIDAELMRDIKELKAALTEFDASRQVWAEIVGCNVKPGRESELRKRLEVMQGKALSNIDAAAWRLRLRIRGEADAQNDRISDPAHKTP